MLTVVVQDILRQWHSTLPNVIVFRSTNRCIKATQPVFGDIAADAGKRQKFANNVVQFMRQYGEPGLNSASRVN